MRMFEIIREDKFIKTAKKFLRKHPNLVHKFKQTVQKLQGNLEKFHAVRLTYEYRVVLVLKIEDEQIILVDIGTHDDVY